MSEFSRDEAPTAGDSVGAAEKMSAEGPPADAGGAAEKLGADSCMDAQLAVPQLAPEGDKPSDTAADGPPASLGSCPSKLCVAASSSERLDGTYELHPEESTGKPAYAKQREGKKPMYLYHSNNKWMLGVDFGSSKKMFASVKASPGCLTPCEPYPFPWMIHADGEKTEARGMRVMDVGGIESAALLALPAEPLCDDAPQSTHVPGQPKKKRSRTAAKTPATAAKKRVVPEAPDAAVQEPPAAGDAQEEEEASESESSDSSSSSASEAPKEAPPTAPRAPVPTAPSAPPPAHLLAKAAEAARAQKLALFDKRIRGSLQKCSAREALAKIEFMAKGPEKFVKTSGGLTVEDIRAFSVALRAEYAPAPAEVPAEKPTSGAPPGAPASSVAATPVPGAPTPNKISKNELPHKTLPPPAKSMLRNTSSRPLPPPATRRMGRGHVRFGIAEGAEPGSNIRLVDIKSYKLHLEQLWYTNPGSHVQCDNCAGFGPQTLGAMQVPLGSTQAAADRFVCNFCLGVHS